MHYFYFSKEIVRYENKIFLPELRKYEKIIYKVSEEIKNYDGQTKYCVCVTLMVNIIR